MCIVIPPNRNPENRTGDVISFLENRTAEEAKQVPYVGGARARNFVALALAMNRKPRVALKSRS